MAMTLQSLSNEKFILGIGRGVAEMFQPIGLPNISFEHLIDCVKIHKKLCNGEIVNYDGVLGKYTDMQLKDLPDVKQPPIILGAIGPKALKVAGTYFDGVILHPFLTPDGVNRCSEIVKDAASKAGKDPKKVKIYATVVLASDLSSDKEEEIVGGRAVSYFQNKNYADILVNFNGWDNNILRKLWDHPLLSNLKSSADQTFTNKELVEVSRILPREWLLSGSAVGTNEHCASRLREYLSSGANHIIIHGSTPDQLAPTIDCFSR
jgi:probable F420-dependent oxidoreductase